MPALLYTLASPEKLAAVLARLRAVATVTVVPQGDSRHVYLDTFDWRLDAAGLCFCLVQSDAGRIARLRRIDSGDELLRVPLSHLPSWPDDLPAGTLRDTLGEVMGIRALVRMADARAQEQLIGIRDGEDKLVAQIHFRCGHVVPVFGSERPLPPSLECESMRGYEAELESVRALLDAMPELQAVAGDFRALTLASAGRHPGDYDNRLRFEFDAQQPAHQAMREIIGHLAGIMAANLNGIRHDTDTEFLHDFRVALRRLRSLLRQFQMLFPAGPVTALAEELRWLGTQTGVLRDLDVLDLALAGYRRRIHPRLQDGVPLLRAEIQRRRAGARDSLVAALGSARYLRLQADLQVLVEDRHWPVDGAGLEPLGQVVADEIRRLHRRVLKRGRSIGPESPPQALHALRKRCKQLRYLLEMFRSLFAADLAESIGRLKELQDLLGGYQDCAVYEDELLSLVGPGAKAYAPEALLAAGALVQWLESRKNRLRRRFAKRFDRFDDKSGNRRLRQILERPL